MTIRFLPIHEPIRTPRDVFRGICAIVAKKHGVTQEELFSTSRVQRIAYARFEVWACLQASGWPYAKIGRTFGRDHTTIMNGVRRYRALAQQEAAA